MATFGRSTSCIAALTALPRTLNPAKCLGAGPPPPVIARSRSDRGNLGPLDLSRRARSAATPSDSPRPLGKGKGEGVEAALPLLAALFTLEGSEEEAQLRHGAAC